MILNGLSRLFKKSARIDPNRTRKIISFSLWGDQALYTHGAIKNVILQKQLMPDWVCVFYVDASVPPNIVEQLKTLGADVVSKDLSIDTSGMMWRFEAVFDRADVAVVIMRDCDSRLTLREKLAVDEWIKSGKKFHTLRDHPNHTHVMMGGMWGARVDLLSAGFIGWYKKEYFRFFKQSDKKFWSDTRFLTERLWKRIKNDQLGHVLSDSLKITGDEKPFPIPLFNDGSFVGNKYDENDHPVYTISTQ